MSQDPPRPAITPAQIVAVLIAGVPAVANLLAAFGVYTITEDQQQALKDALTWLGLVAGALILGDAGLRSARNAAVAKVAVAASTPVSGELGAPGNLAAEVPGGSVPPVGRP